MIRIYNIFYYIYCILYIIRYTFGQKTYQILRVGIPQFTFLPWTEFDSLTGNLVGGFLLEFYNLLGSACIKNKFLSCYHIEFVFINDIRYFQGEMSIVNHEYLSNNITDLTWGYDSMLTTEYSDLIITQPMVSSWYVGLIDKTTLSTNMFQIFSPFTTDLWYVIICSAFFGALVLYCLTSISSDRRMEISSYFTYLYHTSATLLGGDEYDLYNIPPIGRLYRLGILFVVLVTSATYTANLAAFLSIPNYKYNGPQSMSDLQNSIACVPFPDSPGKYIIQKYVKKNIFPPSTLNILSHQSWSLDALHNKECDVIIDLDLTLITQSLNNCGNTYLATNIQFSQIPVFNIMRKSDFDLERNISYSILTILQQPEYRNILENTIGVGKSCDTSNLSGTQPIGIQQMSGMFIIFGVISLITIIGALIDRYLRGKVLKMEDDRRESKLKIDHILHLLQKSLELKGSITKINSSSFETDLERNENINNNSNNNSNNNNNRNNNSNNNNNNNIFGLSKIKICAE